jgi:predicted acyltransferase (DUF342 family)
MTFDRRTFVIPDDTVFDEKTIETKGDVIIGDRCLVQFGIKTDGRIFVGEHVVLDGNLEATKDIRIDIFSRIRGNITSEENVYLGEKVSVEGKLSLLGDLDVADSVNMKEGFEAKGWINIRSPIPVVIYIFIYLTQLLKMGHSEEIERILSEMEDNKGDTIPISEVFLFVPNNSMVGLQNSKIDGSIHVGKKNRLLGNYESKGKVFIDDQTLVHGSIHAADEIFCGKKVEIKGTVESQQDIRLDEETMVMGDVKGERVHLAKTVTIDGTMFAKHGASFITPYDFQAAEKVRRFEDDVEIMETIEDV